MKQRRPGFVAGVWLFVLYAVAWAVGMGLCRSVRWVGLPLVTWFMIVLGVGAVVVGLILVPSISKWERN